MKTVTLGRFVGLESDIYGSPTAVEMKVDADEAGQLLDITSTAEEAFLSAESDAFEVNGACMDTDELFESSASFEDFLHEARQAIKNGGWSRKEARLAALGLNTLATPLGFPVNACTPSMESFTGTRERITSTISIENAITDALKSIWQAIVNSVNKVVNYVRQWYLKVLDGVSRLKKRAEAIKAKATNLTGSAKANTVKTGALEALHINKAVPATGDVTAALNITNDFLKSITATRSSDSFKKRNTDIQATLDKVLDDADFISKEANDKTLNKLKTSLASETGDIPSVKDGIKVNQNDLSAFFPQLASGVTQGIVEGTKSPRELCGGKIFYSIQPVGSKSDAAGSNTPAPKANVPQGAANGDTTGNAPAQQPDANQQQQGNANGQQAQNQQTNESMFGSVERFGRRFSTEAPAAPNAAPAVNPPAAAPATSTTPITDQDTANAAPDANKPAADGTQPSTDTAGADAIVTESKDVSDVLTFSKVIIRDFRDTKDEVDNDKDFKTLTPGDVMSFCDSVIALCDTIIAYKAAYNQYEGASKDFAKKMDQYSKKSSTGDKDAKSRTDIARNLARGSAASVKNNGQSIVQFINYGVTVARNALTWGNQSLAQYGS